MPAVARREVQSHKSIYSCASELKSHWCEYGKQRAIANYVRDFGGPVLWSIYGPIIVAEHSETGFSATRIAQFSKRYHKMVGCHARLFGRPVIRLEK
jgi:hypothetical protein